MRRIRIYEEALEDFADGFRFYEAQDQGLGDYFTSCLRADIDPVSRPGVQRTPGEDTGPTAVRLAHEVTCRSGLPTRRSHRSLTRLLTWIRFPDPVSANA